MYTDVYACVHGQALFAMAHHKLILNCGNWLNREQILLILLDAFNSVNKNSAFMEFIQQVTILRPRHWSSQCVKWREGRRSDTQTLPAPSLSQSINLTSWTSPPLSLTLPPSKRPVAWPAKGIVYHDYCDLFLVMWGLQCSLGGLFCHWLRNDRDPNSQTQTKERDKDFV